MEDVSERADGPVYVSIDFPGQRPGRSPEVTPMLSKILIAWCLMALGVTVHALGLTAAFR
jgi:hypothetical protein